MQMDQMQMDQMQMDQMQMDQMQQNNPQMQNNLQMQNNPQMQIDSENNNSYTQGILSNKIIDQLKAPLLVSVLVLVASMPFLTNLLKTYIPRAFDVVSGNINMIGLVVKSILVGMIFFGVNKFI